MNELLQQVRILDPISQTDKIADVLIVDRIIQAIDTEISEIPNNIQKRNCQGLILGPGLVDIYSHSGEPGFEDRETLASLMAAGAAGGFTRINILPDTSPTIDNPSVLTWLVKNSQETSIKAPATPLSPPRLYFWGALTLALQGQQMTELAELADTGIVGFTDGQPIQNLGLLRRLLEYLQPLNKPVALWPENRDLAGKGTMREGIDSLRFGLKGNPELSETTALAAILECVAAIGTPVHIMRVSTDRSVEMIANAKCRGLPITASTTWMHLILNSEAIGSYEPSLRLEPPLGNPIDQEALIQGIREGIIDAVAIDHSPYTYEEKTVAFGETPPGAIGLEIALPLLWQSLIVTGKLSPLNLWQAISTQPAKCLKQKPAMIIPGNPAELTLFDPQLNWEVNISSLASRSANTPWLGQQIPGKVVQTWIN